MKLKWIHNGSRKPKMGMKTETWKAMLNFGIRRPRYRSSVSEGSSFSECLLFGNAKLYVYLAIFDCPFFFFVFFLCVRNFCCDGKIYQDFLCVQNCCFDGKSYEESLRQQLAGARPSVAPFAARFSKDFCNENPLRQQLASATPSVAPFANPSAPSNAKLYLYHAIFDCPFFFFVFFLCVQGKIYQDFFVLKTIAAMARVMSFKATASWCQA